MFSSRYFYITYVFLANGVVDAGLFFFLQNFRGHVFMTQVFVVKY
jgi:hypothetical protein